MSQKHGEVFEGLLPVNAAQVIVESTPDGIALFDSSNRVVFANGKFCALWNVTPSALLGMTQSELHAHQLALLSDPAQDADFLSVTSSEAFSADPHDIRLTNGLWYERLVFDHGCVG